MDPDVPEFAPGTELPDGAGDSGVYIVDRKLGEGGMATTYLVAVRDPEKANQPFVIKVPRFLRYTPKIFREASWGMRGIDGVVRCLWSDHSAFGEVRFPILVMEFIAYGSLTNRILYPAYTRSRAVGWIKRIAETMNAFPGIHRDLKPENILFVDNKTPLVADFGLTVPLDAASRERWGERPGSGGTPAYMAPEQFMREPVDQRTDIYALGLMLYELMHHELPFSRDDLASIEAAKTSGEMRFEHTGIEPLDQCILTAIESKAERRFQDYHEFLAALNSALVALQTARAR